MTKPRLVNLVVCTDYSASPVLSLYDVRRRWRSPPESIWLVADIENPTEQSFTWDVQVYHRRTAIDHLGGTLELSSPTQLIIPVLLGTGEFEAKSYRLRWLLNDAPAGSIEVDFGHPEATR